MKIKDFRFLPFAFPTIKPLILSRHILKIKKGFFVTLYISHNKKLKTKKPSTKNTTNKVIAELPVIPSIHPLNLKSAKNTLHTFLKSISNKTLPTKMKWYQAGFGLKLPPALKTTPQLLFTLESLLIRLYHQQFLKDFNIPVPLKVPINYLFILKKTIKLPSTIHTLKVKIDTLKNPKKTIYQLLARYPKVLFRLDANKSLTPKSLKKLLSFIPKKNLEYIEDPYPNLIKQLKQFNDFPLALDKDVKNFLHTAIPFPNNTKALVIKPSRDLALSGSLALIKKQKAAKTNINIVISSAYETSIGLWSLAHLSYVTQTAGGLDVEKLLISHPMLHKHHISKSYLTIADNYLEEGFLH